MNGKYTHFHCLRQLVTAEVVEIMDREDKRVGSWAFDRIGCTNSEDEIVGLKKLKLSLNLIGKL